MPLADKLIPTQQNYSNYCFVLMLRIAPVCAIDS